MLAQLSLLSLATAAVTVLRNTVHLRIMWRLHVSLRVTPPSGSAAQLDLAAAQPAAAVATRDDPIRLCVPVDPRSTIADLTKEARPCPAPARATGLDTRGGALGAAQGAHPRLVVPQVSLRCEQHPRLARKRVVVRELLLREDDDLLLSLDSRDKVEHVLQPKVSTARAPFTPAVLARRAMYNG